MNPVLSRNSSGFQDARAASLVVFSPFVHTPVLGGIEDAEGQRQRVRLERQKWDYSARRAAKPGRPRMPDDIEALIRRLARGNAWSYQRIRGELLKLGVTGSKGCIADILRRNGLPPSPQRKGPCKAGFIAA